jgi:hypothetical protein
MKPFFLIFVITITILVGSALSALALPRRTAAQTPKPQSPSSRPMAIFLHIRNDVNVCILMLPHISIWKFGSADCIRKGIFALTYELRDPKTRKTKGFYDFVECIPVATTRATWSYTVSGLDIPYSVRIHVHSFFPPFFRNTHFGDSIVGQKVHQHALNDAYNHLITNFLL